MRMLFGVLCGRSCRERLTSADAPPTAIFRQCQNSRGKRVAAPTGACPSFPFLRLTPCQIVRPRETCSSLVTFRSRSATCETSLGPLTLTASPEGTFAVTVIDSG